MKAAANILVNMSPGTASGDISRLMVAGESSLAISATSAVESGKSRVITGKELSAVDEELKPEYETHVENTQPAGTNLQAAQREATKADRLNSAVDLTQELDEYDDSNAEHDISCDEAAIKRVTDNKMLNDTAVNMSLRYVLTSTEGFQLIENLTTTTARLPKL